MGSVNDAATKAGIAHLAANRPHSLDLGGSGIGDELPDDEVHAASDVASRQSDGYADATRQWPWPVQEALDIYLRPMSTRPRPEPLQEAGARNLTLLHTYDRNVADSEAFVEPIRKAGGVW